jgi:alpha-tubulin suppressor-like RCC1 family protein
VSDHFCSGTTCKVDALQVSISSTHACMVLADGTVRCWGKNANRELGTTSANDASTPQQVQGITSAKIVTVNDSYSLALLANGSIVYWGTRPTSYDYDSHMYTSTTQVTPTAIAGLGTAIDVVTGSGLGSTCALINDHTVHCWGLTVTDDGQTNFLDIPTDKGLIGVSGISSGMNFQCAALSAGGVKCWGSGTESELGSANFAATPVATLVSGTVSKIRSGDYFTCVLLTTGVVQCWGVNQEHELGANAGTIFATATPQTITGLSSVKDLAGGAENVCALDTSGGIKCWGDDGYYQLGDGNMNVGSGEPVSVQGLTGPASSVAAGSMNACAVLQSGSVQCWGRSIGDLSSSPTISPTTVW